MDCDDVAVLLAAAERATLSGVDETRLHNHLDDCEPCRVLAAGVRTADDGRWVAWVPEDALSDPDLLILPVVDPVVFSHPQQIAAGGMGRISRAHDRRLGRDVAIKEVLDPDLRARFEREAIITARLQHPAIVPVYEAGMWPDGSAFYTMRLVSGGTLATAIARTRTIEQRLALLPHVIAVTEALAYAHSRRIIHRDLKPGNVLVGEFGETVVIDWGLAKELDGLPDPDGDSQPGSYGASPTDLTAIGSVLGTPGFMPPEQASGDELDERADVYALGAILYNLLAGTPPYFDQATERDSDQLVEATRSRPPTPLAQLAAKAPPDLRAIAERAMARDAQRRYATAREMAEELRRFEAGQLIAREYTLRELLARWVRRHRTAVVVGTMAIVALAVVGAVALRGITRSRAAERSARRGAEASVGALLEEQGRNAVLAADHERALPYLAAAYQRRDTVAVRHLLAVATRDLDLFEHALVPDAVVHAVGFLPDGQVATIQAQTRSELTLWRDGAVVATKRFDPPDGQEVRFSPDARLAVMVCEGTRLEMFDVAALAPLWQIDDPFYADQIDVVFDPAATRIAARSSASGVIQVRDARTGALIATPTTAAAGAVIDLAFSPDGGRLAAVADDGTLVVWDAPGFAPIAAMTVGSGPTRLAFVGPDRIVVGTEHGTAYLWDLEALSTRALAGHYGPIEAIAVSPDGTTIATGDDRGAVKVWSRSGDLLGEARDLQGKVTQLAMSPDGALLLGAGESNHAQLWDMPSLGLERAIDIGASDAAAVAWAPDGKRFAIVGLGDARIWRAPVGRSVARFPSIASALVGSVVVSEQGADLVVNRIETGGEALRIPAVKPLPARSDDLWFAPGYVQVSQDGRRALVRGFDAGTIYDLATGALVVELHPQVMAIEQLWLSADGRYTLELGISAEEGGTPVRITDATTGKTVLDLKVPDAQSGAIAPDGSRVALAAGDTPATLWRVPDGARLSLPPIPGGPTEVRFDPTGHRLIGYGIETPVIVDVTTGAVVASLVSPTPLEFPGVVDVRFDRSGHLVAGWSESQVVVVWNADTGAALATFADVAPRAYAFSADGGRFATGASDGSVRIWETATGRLLEHLQPHRAAINGLAFSDDDTRLLVQAIDGFATVWDVALEQRPPSAIADLASHGRWTLVDGLAVPRKSPAEPR